MSLIFPRRCVLCGEPMPLFVKGGAMICNECAARVRQHYRCTEGIRIDGADGAAAPLLYRGAVAEAMKRYKFSHYQHYADWFAAQMTAELAARLEDWQPEVITYVPIGMMRRYQRGYNQSELLARAVAEKLNLPCRPLLSKRMFVTMQSHQKSPVQRRRNASRAFAPANQDALNGKRVVLVDDVITTGATAAAACAVLRDMGAGRVYVLSAARVR